MRKNLTVAAIFLTVALALSGMLPLWLDEIIQLQETRGTTPAQLFESLPHQPGAAPLGYLIQQTSMHVTGYSERWARFPSAVFVAGAVFVTGMIAAELGLAWPWLAAAIFALFPETLRYACESRVYSQALLFSTLATWLFLRRSTTLYTAALIAAIYTQPYAVFVGVAHLVYERRREAAIALGIAIAAFLPWYLHTRDLWSTGLSSTDVHFAISAKTPLMLFREFAGAGYWGSGLLLILCAMSARHSRFLASWIGVTVLLAILADAASGYFVAARQILWILPGVAIAAALGVEKRPRAGRGVLAVLAAVCVWFSIRYFTAPHDDFGKAANTLMAEVRQGACVAVVPAYDRSLYEFFRPEIASANCLAPRVILVASPYTTPAEKQAGVSRLLESGYSQRSVSIVGRSELSVFAH
ncbi:MAG TPA: hypothetical protein VHC90_19940 [Bryobacteraceae bacterium]|nr:hypothetical protein [Bryobacteraceae bacterium]